MIYGNYFPLHLLSMRPLQLLILSFFTLIIAVLSLSFTRPVNSDDTFISYTIDPSKSTLKLYWRNDKNEPLRSLQALKDYCASKGEKLLFAMNGGMYTEDRQPLGLYIENGKTLHAINKRTGSGNFYLQPNGILYINKDQTVRICTTAQFGNGSNVLYATQSGPMLLVNGQINTVFTSGSVNTNIRNGVGLLPGNRLLFAMSKAPVNFYDFANFFKQAGCSNALYLDGFVSRTYLPEKNWLQTSGDFGVMIGATQKQ
ncbi:phosphodiester glycosidase family protein [Ferruginibacter sp.]